MIDKNHPLFIVGMPRSGTKLLRDLLNQHSKIGIPKAESHFIPYFHDKYKNEDFNNANNIKLIYSDLIKTNFYSFLNSRENIFLGYEIFYDNAKGKDITEIIKFVLLHFVDQNPLQKISIWGDKTPGYIRHTKLLKSLYRNAKFIHIIRDPRDYCYSINRVWKKSIKRASYRYKTEIFKIRENVTLFKDDYYEVFYENLISNPLYEMQMIAQFLEIPYEESMIELSQAPENYGDTKGQTQIISTNKNKYVNYFSKKQVELIESYCFDIFDILPYELLFAKKEKIPSKLLLLILKIYDGIVYVPFAIKDHGGILKGIVNNFRGYSKSSWRF